MHYNHDILLLTNKTLALTPQVALMQPNEWRSVCAIAYDCALRVELPLPPFSSGLAQASHAR